MMHLMMTIFRPRRYMKNGSIKNAMGTVDPEKKDNLKKILLVDDEKIIFDLWKEVLSAQGYQVDWRVSSFDAYQAFQSSPWDYDLVITELSTVNIKGIVLNELIKKIRPDTPVIILTGFSYPHDEIEAKSVGIRHFLYKPIKAETLCRIIKQTLAQKTSTTNPGKFLNAASVR